MTKAKLFVVLGAMFASTGALPHGTVDPIAGPFANAAGNGGLAWFQFILNSLGL